MPSDLPPLHLVAVWDYLCIRNPDPDSIIAFAAIRLPGLFLPDNLRPVQEFLAKTYPERNRQIFCLHYQLVENEPAVDEFMRKDVDYPSWKHLEDLIGSLGHLRPSGTKDYFSSPIDLQPTLWFSIFRLLGQQYTYECQHFGSNPRRVASLLVAQELEDEVFGVLELPSLNHDLLPGHAQHAVERFCRATECNKHTCKCLHTWRKLDVETRRRYAAAYALLYSTDVVPLLSQDNCDACENIRRLYECVDAISAGEILLESNKIAKVVDFIERLAVSCSNFTETIFKGLIAMITG
jgi:hypothetical protein